MKDTWIWFKPHPEDDGLGTKWEKVAAIGKYLKESLPGCNQIIKHFSYNREIRPWRVGSGSVLIIVINRIGELSALLYEEKHAGRYGLVVHNGYGDWGNTTPVTSRQLNHKSRSEVVNTYEIPPYLDITEYLKNKRGG